MPGKFLSSETTIILEEKAAALFRILALLSTGSAATLSNTAQPLSGKVTSIPVTVSKEIGTVKNAVGTIPMVDAIRDSQKKAISCGKRGRCVEIIVARRFEFNRKAFPD